MSRGGARKGSGRKPIGESVKIPYGTKLPPIIVAYLRQSKNAAETIELEISRSCRFKTWSKNNSK